MNGIPLYKIEGFNPPRYGLSISLLSDFAKIVFEEKLPEHFHKNIIEQGKYIVKQNFSSYFVGSTSICYEPYIFAKSEKENLSCLPSHIKVPGSQNDAHALDLDFQSFNLKLSRENGYVDYTPHNIDGWNQAHTLLHLWLIWIINVNSELKGKHGDLITRFTSKHVFSPDLQKGR